MALSLEKIFSSDFFGDEGFDRPRWCSDGSSYTTLRKVENSSISAFLLADLTSTTSSANNIANTQVKEIILHDVKSSSLKVFVSVKDLIPSGKSHPLSIDDYATSNDRSKVLIFTNAQKVWRLKTRGSYWILDVGGENADENNLKLRQLGGGSNSLMFATFSPNMTKVAYVKDHNIYVEDLESHEIIPLTRDGSSTIINGTFDWVYEEEFHLRNGFRWSPDSSLITFWQLDQSSVPIVNLVNNTDSLYPKLIPIHYPKTGQLNASVKIGVVATSGEGDIKWLDLPGDSRDNYVADLNFNKFTGEIYIQYLNRVQNHLQVIMIDPVQGTLSTIHSDDDEAWVDITQELNWINKGSQFLYISDKNGWKQIYLVSNDQTIPPLLLTPDEVDVVQYLGCDEESQVVYYVASPDDPLRRYLFKVDLSGLNNVRVTPSSTEFKGTNSYSLSADSKFAVHTFSSVLKPTVTTIISLPDHTVVNVLATNNKLFQRFNEINMLPIEFFRVEINSASNVYDSLNNDVEMLSKFTNKQHAVINSSAILDAWCIYPPDFNSSSVYPVIFHVYGEPAAQIVKDQWDGRLGLWHRMLAQRGAVVICIDNRGTPSPRGATWRKSVYGLVGLIGSADQAAAVKKILIDRPYLDSSKVAIWGWSGGGSMSLNALFRFTDVYTTAVSIAPVPDMKLYDTIYQERYMNLPSTNAFGYHVGSPVHFAKNMKDTQNLLVIHGTGDDNCHYQGTECLINELILYNKPFNMVAYPNRTHSISEGNNTTRHLFEHITRYFKSHGFISSI